MACHDRFIGEESTASGQKVELTDAPTWVIDPIDGTMNFVHGLPHTCISVALLINKVAEIGIVYNPILEQLFTARKGQGAFLNGAPIHVSDEKGKLFSIFNKKYVHRQNYIVLPLYIYFESLKMYYSIELIY